MSCLVPLPIGIEQVVHKHRVVLLARHTNAERAEEEYVELHILPHLGNLLVLEQWTQYRGVLALDIVARSSVLVVTKRYVPRLVRLRGERQAHYAVAKDIEARGLEVEAEEWLFFHLCNNFA